EEITALLKSKVVFLILDLRLILFINSTAIGTLVKVHRDAKAHGGRLILCRPSNFVHGVLDSLGLLELFAFADDPEKAFEQIGASSDGMDMGGDNSVILRIPNLKGSSVARLAGIEEEGMVLAMEEAPPGLCAGIECQVKFRLPLFLKGHYFEGSVMVEEVTAKDAETKIKCTFQSMKDDDLKSIAQFVEEMKFLRAEARGKTKG
ncbi:MAG: STAS domain-containing protein, partial [Planctomycetes bacterium]|nr:STAS domain-containing protein [Planctomycetota bacterium]